MELKQASRAEFEIIFDTLYENSLWLEEKNIFQWPLTWLESKYDEIKNSVALGLFYTVNIDQEIAAVVELKTLADDAWKNKETGVNGATNTGHSNLYIHKLAIRRKYSKQKLGRKVLGLITEYAAHNRRQYLRLDCVAHNVALRQYYESCQFKWAGEVNLGEIALCLYEFELESRETV